MECSATVDVSAVVALRFIGLVEECEARGSSRGSVFERPMLCILCVNLGIRWVWNLI